MRVCSLGVSLIVGLFCLTGPGLIGHGGNGATLASPLVTYKNEINDERSEGTHDDTAQTLPVDPSILQVTGTTNNFTISAQHADVLVVLKLLFAQAHKQFVPDATVTGDVTLSLTNQRFETALNAICTQALLKYTVDTDLVYRFQRDNAALGRLIVNTQNINSLLLERLRKMGYGPGTTAFDLRLGVAGGVGASDTSKSASTSSGGYNRVNGLADKKTATDKMTAKSDAVPAPQVDNGVNGSQLRNLNIPGANGGGVAGGAVSSAARKQSRGEGRAEDPIVGTARPVGAAKSVGGSNAKPAREEDGALNYQGFLYQNRLVSINTNHQDVPVRDILLEIGKQVGIPVLINPSVPSGSKFVLNGFITPRPYTNLLTVLCEKAQLEWRMVNERIMIVATPQFKLRLNNTAVLPQTPGVIVLPERSGATESKRSEKQSEKKSKEDK